MEGRRARGGDRASDDDAAAAAPRHAFARGDAGHIDAAQIGRDDLVEFGKRKLLRSTARLDHSGIGEQGFDRPEPRFDIGEGRFGRVLVSDIEWHRLCADFRGGFRIGLGIDVRNHDAPAALDQDSGRRKANAAGAARHHGNAVASFVPFHHCTPFCVSWLRGQTAR
jgi:hypothetical protein